jgi:hypothetical protein
MLRIRCPNCATILSAEASPHAQVCRCPSCHKALRIPARKSPPAPAEAPAAQDAGYELLEEDIPAGKLDREGDRPGPAPDAPGPPRRKRRRRKEARGGGPGEAWRYYTDALGVYGWSLVALAGAWAFGLLLSCLVPPAGALLLLLGSALAVLGNLWIVYVAFTDNPLYGILCFSTCLFIYVYVFMNLEETWRPAVLVLLGNLMAWSGAVFFFAASAAAAG